MAVPVEWLGNFQVNTGAAATGGQTDPQIIGLANGNILVVWTEAADGGIAGGQAGSDIVGKIYNAEGNLVADALRLNSSFAEDEGDFDIAATNDGGFVMVYVGDGLGASRASRVMWERYDTQGHSTDLETVENEFGAQSFLANPHVAVDLQTNQSFITYTDDIAADTDVRGNIVTAAGVLGTEFDAAQNSADFDGEADVAVLSNGNFVSVYEEKDGAATGSEFRIMGSNGALVSSLRFNASATDPKVASLAGGGFVVAFETPGNGGDVGFQAYDNAGGLVTGVFAALGADLQNEAEVVALPDGDFVIVWDNDTDNTLEGARFDANGLADGATFVIENAGFGAPNIGVTGDGRLLFTWLTGEGGGEVVSSIWDPRDGVIDATDYFLTHKNILRTDVITGGAGATVLNGGGRDGVTLLGQAGDDTITGGLQDQTIRGGGGADSIIGGESAGANSIGDDSIDGESGSDTIIGAAGDDTIRGSGTADSLMGGNGADRLFGGAGRDTIDGGGGNDTIVVLNGEAIDNVEGGFGNDLLDLRDIGNPGDGVVIDLDGGIFTGLGGTRSIAGIERVLGTQLDDSIRLGIFSDSIDGGGGNDLLDGGQVGSDRLRGGAGNDTLIGGSGADKLVGGQGSDEFRFTDMAAAGPDRIVDFTGGVDRIALDGAVFGLAPGVLDAAAFVVANSAQDAGDRLIYKAGVGTLFFDADGTGAQAQVLIATLTGAPVLSAGDFIVI